MLIIDDNPDSREYLQACLEGDGYEVELAQDGEEGLKKAQVFIPSAVLLGLSADGAEICRELKSNPVTAQAAVIVVGAQDDKDKMRVALEAGADDYLMKPFHNLELTARLEARLRQRTAWWPQEQEALLDLTRMLASSLNLVQLLHLVAARTATVLKVDRCSFVLVHPEGETARVAAASEDASLHDIVSRDPGGNPDQAALRGRPGGGASPAQGDPSRPEQQGRGFAGPLPHDPRGEG